MRNYPEIAMEKAMTRQEIILRAYAKKINWIEAAEILGLSYRHLGRIKAKYEEVGIDGLFDGRVGKESEAAGAGWRGGGGVEAVSGKVFRLQRAAFSREVV